MRVHSPRPSQAVPSSPALSAVKERAPAVPAVVPRDVSTLEQGKRPAVTLRAAETPAPALPTPATPAKTAQIDLRTWQPDKLIDTLVHDVKVGFHLLREMPPAVTVFGGARIKKDDPYYELGREIGRELARANVPPRTGAGPGIMEAIPEGHKQEMTRLRDVSGQMRGTQVEVGTLQDVPVCFKPVVDGVADHAHIPPSDTQGFNIKLPYEQAVSKSIDHHQEIAEFLYRKVVLYENSRGLVTFPGGYGTLDELFQVWTLHQRGKHHDPMALVGKAYWQPLLDVVREQAVEKRHLVDAQEWNAVKTFDEAPALLEYLGTADGVKGFEEEPGVLARRMANEISAAIKTLDKLPPAVAFVGGDTLAADDPALAVARKAAELLTRDGVPTRVGAGIPVARAVAQGARAADPQASVQGFSLGKNVKEMDIPGVKDELHVEEYTTHRELMSRRTDALVALPGDLTTLHHVFALLCEVQCGKVPPNPIILVGKDYWEPIFKQLEKTMLNGTRQTIAPEDLKLFTITDDPQQVADLVKQSRAEHPAAG